NLAAFLFTHVMATSNVEQRLAKHRRLVVQRPSPSLIGGPSNWLITLIRPRNRPHWDFPAGKHNTMTNGSQFRPAIERMEEHEIIDRLKRDMFSEEARPIAEAVLRERGVDPQNPAVPQDQVPPATSPKSTKPRLVPGIFGVFAAIMAGRHIGAAIGGAVGAAVVSALFFLLGWWIGTKLAKGVQPVRSKPARFGILLAAVCLWIVASGVIGILAQTGSGRIRP
ncbi:MAG: hypothetical protein Q8L95_09435, partial [Burkholderiales bacterium]|nr:hypothetical protein [Burkholderiales bacterium]